MSEWNFIDHCVGGDRFEIASLNVWDHEWLPVKRPPGVVAAPTAISMPPPIDQNWRVTVKDPLYGQEHTFDVYEITDGSRTVEFAAGEFSSLIYGFYVRKTGQ